MISTVLQLAVISAWIAIGTSLPVKSSSTTPREERETSLPVKNSSTTPREERETSLPVKSSSTAPREERELADSSVRVSGHVPTAELIAILKKHQYNVSREDIVKEARITIVGLEHGMHVIKKEVLDKHYLGVGKFTFQEVQDRKSDYRERLFKETVLERPIADQLRSIDNTAAYDFKLLFRVDYTLRELHKLLSHLQAANGRFKKLYATLAKSMNERTLEVRFVRQLVMEFCSHQRFPIDFTLPSEVRNRRAPTYLNHLELDADSYFILDEVKVIMTFIIDSFQSMPSES